MENDTSLESLLAWDGVLENTADIEFKRENFTFNVQVKSITNEIENKLEKVCSTPVKDVSTGRVIDEIDEEKLAKLQIYNCTVSPDLSSNELQTKFNSGSQQYEIVDKLFLPGEKLKLVRLILRLSGFENQDVMESQISNLVNG